MASSSARPAAPPVVVPAPQGNNIIMNPLQRGNPILEHIKNVGKEYGDIIADYQVGRTTGVLFLSLKYHRLHPEYIITRIEHLGISYNLRILLIWCDVTEHRDPIRELTKTCLINNVTIIVAFSAEEAGHYLTIFKQYEHKPPTLIKERQDKDHSSMFRNALTSISKVNKTDVKTLNATFGSFANIAKADANRIQDLPGFGQVKVKHMKDAFEKPFRNNATVKLANFPLAKGKEKEREAASSGTMAAPTGGRQRSPSPLWDIERDLDSPPPPAPKNAISGRPPRSPSPIWDIELDLNTPSPEP
ncbi:DNA repair protein rad10 [Cylindrobasidium torrendii FP15055 ss-10]|uniref:DNA repair protein rad10 n=1 Tax=Cylindrobasidium torrendii FP15055 ss-10 TaxID=1314674 RepID=A0A0D7BU39_9AGAR|nr:DNA repair protein rad10 [Cylindrobasidium torrendii FP15055 ss-10]